VPSDADWGIIEWNAQKMKVTNMEIGLGLKVFIEWLDPEVGTAKRGEDIPDHFAKAWEARTISDMPDLAYKIISVADGTVISFGPKPKLVSTAMPVARPEGELEKVI
jgi:hypothetical protein